MGFINDLRRTRRVEYEEIVEKEKRSELKKNFTEIVRDFSKDNYANGEEWFKSGLPFEEAPIELQQNTAFKNGFERGKRLAYIQELNETENNKKTR